MGYAPGKSMTAPMDIASAPPSTNRPQHTLLALVQVVKNLCDEGDLQCLAFLAGELGLLQNTPFCFSLAQSQDSAVPESLILRDTFATMLRQHMLGWDCGKLCALVDAETEPDDRRLLFERLAWLAALQPHERQALTQVVVQSRAAGGAAARPVAEGLLQRILSGANGQDAPETVARRLLMVCRSPAQA